MLYNIKYENDYIKFAFNSLKISLTIVGLPDSHLVLKHTFLIS